MSAFTLLFAWALISFAISNMRVLKSVSILVLAISAYLSFSLSPMILSGFSSSDGIALFELILFIVMGAVILSEDEKISITQSIFITTASVALLQSTSFLNFIISFESLSIISFVLVSNIKNEDEAKGAIKMYISGAIATALIVLGSAFYLFENHPLNAPLENIGIFGVTGLWIILTGLFYKLTIVPMHTWAADSYAEVRPAHSAILSGVAKTVAFIAIFKFFTPFFMQNLELNMPILITLALLTMTLGNFLALFQKRVSKILAYSSIAHAGYMLLAFVAIKSSFASTGLLYIAIAYIFMQTALFLLLDKLSKGKTDIYLNDFKGLYQKDKTSALLFTIQLFSLAGVPLLAGFISKAILVYAVVDVNLPIVALITLLNSALSVGYYAWIVKHIYFDEANPYSKLIKLEKTPLIAQFILLAGTIYFGIFAYSVFGMDI